MKQSFMTSCIQLHLPSTVELCAQSNFQKFNSHAKKALVC